jgi:hypothetical protein
VIKWAPDDSGCHWIESAQNKEKWRALVNNNMRGTTGVDEEHVRASKVELLPMQLSYIACLSVRRVRIIAKSDH